MSTAEKLRNRAASLQPRIDAKFNPAIAQQNLTPRRCKIAGGMRREGERLQEAQGYLFALANAHEAGTCPHILARLNNAQHLLDLANQWMREPSARLVKAGITTSVQLAEAKAALKSMGGTPEEPDPRDKLIRQSVEELVGQKIPGFFPTPPDVIADLLIQANLSSGLSVLEPSAGKGDISDALRTQGFEPDVIELNYRLDTILRLKGYNVLGMDFLATRGSWDRVIMNPPFEDGQDIDHVRHAYDHCLAPGGIVVSVVSAGPFHRNDKKATEFRAWLAGLGAESYRNEVEAFKKAFRSTSVATYVVVIRKPLS